MHSSQKTYYIDLLKTLVLNPAYENASNVRINAVQRDCGIAGRVITKSMLHGAGCAINFMIEPLIK